MLGSRVALAFFCLLLVAGCATPRPLDSTPTLPPRTAAHAMEVPTPEPTTPPTPSPSPTPMMQLAISDAPLQAWTDPNLVTGLLVHKNELWAATQSGVVCWNLDKGETARYGTADGLAAPATRGIALDAEGLVWIGYAELDAWSAWNGDSWITYDERERAVEAHYEALLHAPHTDPRLWVTRPDSSWVWLPEIAGRAESYDGQRWRLYGEHHGVRSGTWLVDVSPDGQVWAVGSAVSTVYEGQVYWDDHSYYSGMGTGCSVTSGAVDAKGGLWLGYACESKSGGLMYWDTLQGRWRGYEQALNPVIPQQVYWTHVSEGGAVWVGGTEAVIWKDPESPWRRIDVPGLVVHAIYESGEGNLLWLGTDQGVVALSRNTGSIVMHLRVPAPPIPANVLDLARGPDGAIWLATARGVIAVNPASGKLTVIHPGPAIALASIDGNPVWISGPGGVLVSNGVTEPKLVFQANVRSLALSPDGGLAVAYTIGGDLVRLGKDGTHETLGNVPTLLGATAKALAAETDGSVWIGTGVGLGYVAPDGTARLFTAEDGLPSNDVLALAWGPEGELWIGTRNGLARRRADGRWTRFTTQSTEGGLRSMTVRDFWVGLDGVLWMATGAGLSSREPGQADWAYHDLAGAQAVVTDDDGNVWVGTSAGLMRVATSVMTPVP